MLAGGVGVGFGATTGVAAVEVLLSGFGSAVVAVTVVVFVSVVPGAVSGSDRDA